MQIKERYLAIFDRYGVTDHEEFSSLEDAKKFLLFAGDDGMIMDIGVVDTNTNELVWYNDYLGEEECKQKIDLFTRAQGRELL